MKFSLYPFLLLASLLLVAACDSNDEISEEQLLEQRILQLENMDEFGAKPILQEFVDASTQLLANAEAFAQDISTANLSTLKAQWKATTIVFKKCELYDIGDISDNFIHFRIHRWPIKVEALIDTLGTNTPATASYVANLGSNIVGLGAIEYLLFGMEPAATLTAMQNDAKRLDYLVEATRYLKDQAVEMQGIWDNYSPRFVVATETRISGGQNQMTNAVLALLEESARLRLGKALGEDTGGTLNQELLEAFRSDASVDFLKSGFDEWKLYFYGDFANSTDNYGFDDYLLALNNDELLNRMNTAIEVCDDELNKLGNSLNQELASNTAQVTAVRDALRALAVLVRNEMAIFIGATITVNETDGD
ncbi:MAG: imelysin family protein [Bacteroidota bacterium]